MGASPAVLHMQHCDRPRHRPCVCLYIVPGWLHKTQACGQQGLLCLCAISCYALATLDCAAGPATSDSVVVVVVMIVVVVIVLVIVIVIVIAAAAAAAVVVVGSANHNQRNCLHNQWSLSTTVVLKSRLDGEVCRAYMLEVPERKDYTFRR